MYGETGVFCKKTDKNAVFCKKRGHVGCSSDQSEEAAFLKSLQTPTILTKYPPSIRQLLIRSEFNGFFPKPKNRFQIYNSPKQIPDPLDEHRQKRFKPPPRIAIKRVSLAADSEDSDQQSVKRPKPFSKL
jgi:hypothetical protein